MEDNGPKLSLKKLALFIVGLIVLIHIKDVLRVFRQIFNWFSESLEFMKDFPKGAQAAIAFLTIILTVVIVYRAINK